MNVCPRCQATLETPLACSGCGELLAAAGGAHADPFAIFGLEPKWALDEAGLKRRLLRFARLVHPDFFATAGEPQRQAAEAASAALNSAFEVLVDEASRADWLIRHFGGPDEQADRSMPKSFLMEVLDWNEALEAARASAPSAPERQAIVRLAAELGERRRQVFDSIGARFLAHAAGKSGQLALARQDLNAARYLDKTLAEIAGLRVAQSLST